MPVGVETNPCLPGLSPVCGKTIVARFDGASMSSDGGLLALREVERRHGIASRLAACISDRRAPGRVRHGLDEIIRERKNPGLSGREKAVPVRFQSAIQHCGADDGDAMSALRGPPHPLLLGHASVGDLVDAALCPRG
jgi:hypothetical protein